MQRIIVGEWVRLRLDCALVHSCGSTPAAGETRDAWKQRLIASPVRVQSDPERDLHLRRLDHRSIQIGLAGDAVDRYVSEWITRIEDTTALAREIAAHLECSDTDRARDHLPTERPYPVDGVLGAM